MLSKRFRNEMYESVLQINHFKSDDAHQEDQSTCISNLVFSSQFEYNFFLLVCWLGWQESWITDACLVAECLTGYGTWDDTSLTISHELFLLTLHNSSVLLQLGPGAQQVVHCRRRGIKRNDRHYIKKDVFLHRSKKSLNPCPHLYTGAYFLVS